MQNEIEVEFALQHFYYNYQGAMYAKRPDEPKKEKKEKKKTSKACNVLVVTASRGILCSCYSKDCEEPAAQKEEDREKERGREREVC